MSHHHAAFGAAAPLIPWNELLAISDNTRTPAVLCRRRKHAEAFWLALHSQGGASMHSGAMLIPRMFHPGGGMTNGSMGPPPNRMPTGSVQKPATPQWTGPDWPASLGRSMGAQSHMGMGTSPFGRSVDMVDVVTQLMEAGGASDRAERCCLGVISIKATPQ